MTVKATTAVVVSFILSILVSRGGFADSSWLPQPGPEPEWPADRNYLDGLRRRVKEGN